MARKKRTPEQIAERQRVREETRKLWDYLDREWDKLEERAAREGRPLKIGRPQRPLWAGPRSES